jgi:uncharacterized protein with FMN-binding domain
MNDKGWVLTRALVVSMLGFIVAGCGTISAIDPAAYLATVSVNDVNLSGVPDGTYTGDYTLVLPPGQYAMNRHFIVQAAVAAGHYAGITIVEPASFTAEPAFLDLIGRITSSNSLLVDAVSGATYSTRAMLKAVEAAVAL